MVSLWCLLLLLLLCTAPLLPLPPPLLLLLFATFSLFGEDVALLLDMDRCNEPNCIQVSQAALELLTSPQRQFVTGCKISHNERDIPLLRLTAEVRQGREQQWSRSMLLLSWPWG